MYKFGYLSECIFIVTFPSKSYFYLNSTISIVLCYSPIESKNLMKLELKVSFDSVLYIQNQIYSYFNEYIIRYQILYFELIIRRIKNKSIIETQNQSPKRKQTTLSRTTYELYANNQSSYITRNVAIAEHVEKSQSSIGNRIHQNQHTYGRIGLSS